MMMYNGIGAVLYLTAFVANAASVPTGFAYERHFAAAAVRFCPPMRDVRGYQCVCVRSRLVMGQEFFSKPCPLWTAVLSHLSL